MASDKFLKELELLKALLWKNILLRWSSPIGWLLELIFPALLAALLFSLYLAKPTEKNPTCYYLPKSLPSAGGVTSLQAYLCTATNACQQSEKSSAMLGSSTLSLLVEQIQKAFDIKLKTRRKREFEHEMESLVMDAQTIDALAEAVGNHNEKWNLLYTMLRTNIYSETNNKMNFQVKKLQRMKRDFSKSKAFNAFVRLLIREVKDSLAFMAPMNSFFCGLEMEGIETQWLRILTNPDFSIEGGDEYVHDGDLSDFCNNVMKFLESSPYGPVVQYFKPFLLGKILYSPDAPVINKIMKKLGDSFTKIKDILDAMKQIKRAARHLRIWDFNDIANKYRNEEEILKEAVKTRSGRAIFKDEEADDPDDEEIFKRKMDKYHHLLEKTRHNYNRFLKEVGQSSLDVLIDSLECFELDKVEAVSSESAATKLLGKMKLWAYISFTNVGSGAEELPDSVTYKIRTPAEKAPTTQVARIVNASRPPGDPLEDVKGITGGTIHLQNIIDSLLIMEYTGKQGPGIILQQMPYPCFQIRKLQTGELFPLLFMLSWIIFFGKLIKQIVTEKEILFKDVLRIFGVKSYHHLVAFFLDGLITAFIAAFLSSILYALIFGGFFVFLIFQIAFACSCIGLAFLISSFLYKASFSATLGNIIYLFFYVVYAISFMTPSKAGQFFLSLISNVACGFGCLWVLNMIESAVPVSEANMNHSPDAGNIMTMAVVIIMLLLDTAIYIALAVYFENIFSASLRRPWHYWCHKSFWTNCFKKGPPTPETEEAPESTLRRKKKIDSNEFESDPPGLLAGIELINVSKEFGTGKNKNRVVNNLTMTFYESQITSFLGHNGAGKSTTVAMMTGVLPVTSGKIRIYGVDLQKDPEAALKSVGICMQENVLLGNLSARNHLVLIAKLKKLSEKETKRNIKELLEVFELKSRADDPVKNLSGGWKRKVCVAMAFMGGSKTIFLDEPTAGIDPFARRAIWDVLVKLREGRTIILITHHLDEADVLGDRIAIIASGELKCCGTSAYLKSQLAKGYTLTVDTSVRPNMSKLTKGKNSKKSLSPEAQEISAVVKSAIGNAEFEEERGCEIIFSLPPRQSASDLNRVFDALERNKQKCNITSYGVSAVSLEEVFINVLAKVEAEENARKQPPGPAPQKPVSEDTERQIDYEVRQKKIMRARFLYQSHFVALCVKRYLHTKRNYWFLIFQFLGPLLFVFFNFLSMFIVYTQPAVPVDVSEFNPAVIFYSNNFPAHPRLASYEDALLGPYGMGASCVLKSSTCSMESIEKGSLTTQADTIDMNNCTCLDSKLVCTGNATEDPPNAKMTTGHRLFNMTGRHIVNWILLTEFTYSVNRIGGITFGADSTLTGVSFSEFLQLFDTKKFADALAKALEDLANQKPADFAAALAAALNQDYGKKLFADKDPIHNIIVWFNGANKIASMALVNGVSNLVLRASLPKGSDPSRFSIQTIAEPFRADRGNSAKSSKVNSGFLMFTVITLSCGLWLSIAIIYYVEERACGMKHLQIIYGLNRVVYWLGNLLWDMILFSVFACLLFILIFIFAIPAYTQISVFNVFVAVLYAYALTQHLFIYIFSNVFKVPTSAFIFVITWIAVVATILVLFAITLSWIISKNRFKIFELFVIILPEYSLARCILNLVMGGPFSPDSESSTSKFHWDSTTKYIVYILIIGAAYLVILISLEFNNIMPCGLITKCLSSFRIMCVHRQKTTDDEDVLEEKMRVKSGRAKKEGDRLIVKNLTKVFCRQAFPAVNHVYVGIKRGECLGLLGMNGAGKSTMFNMLSGQIMPTLGDATIAGYSMFYNPIQARLLVGYCPQMHALDNYLTVKEHLVFYCTIRGFEGSRMEQEVRMLIDLMDLSKHEHKLAKKLSGGNKRKLNAAIALLCEPELVLLDEPTAGMDVLARRFLWARMQEVLHSGRSLVLTTHSLEECQALATQVCIMFMGRFVCFGSSQRLKSKFNEGYIVQMRLTKGDKMKELTQHLDDNLHGWTNIRSQHTMVNIRLHPDTNLGRAVNALGEAKRKNIIDDYSINQTTLESVFLKLIGDVDREKSYQRLCCGCC